MPKKAKTKPRKVKFYKKNLKIPESQNKTLRQYCAANQTTENKIFREALSEYLVKHNRPSSHPPIETNPNQLTLFDLIGEDTIETGT